MRMMAKIHSLETQATAKTRNSGSKYILDNAKKTKAAALNVESCEGVILPASILI